LPPAGRIGPRPGYADKPEVSRTCFEEAAADRHIFTITNSGAASYNYTLSKIFSAEPGYPPAGSR